MDGLGYMPAASMVCMACSLAVSFILPLGLALWARRRGGRWRAFALGAAVFPVFAMVLESMAHRVILGGPAGGVLQGSVWLYALYAGLMAGIFEETGRFLAFTLLKGRGGAGRPADALMYGAGHGGAEAILLVGAANVSNLLLSFWLNAGTLEAHLGTMTPEAVQSLSQAVNTPSLSYLWGGAERIVAVAIHLALSVLVYASAGRGGKRWLFPTAIALHAGVDACAVLAAAALPLWAVELTVLVWAAALVFLARQVWTGKLGKIPERT